MCTCVYENGEDADRIGKAAAEEMHRKWTWERAVGEIKQRLDALISVMQPDIIHAEEMRMAAYLPALRGTNAPAKQSVTFHNVESELIRKTGSSPYRLGKPIVEFLHARNLERYEQRISSVVDLCLAYSPVDKKKYENKYADGKWALTSGGARTIEYAAEDQRQASSALIAGSLNYYPNIEGIHWFIDEVLPHIKNIKISVAGSHANAALRAKILNANMEFIDTPPDLAPLYRSHAMSLVPLLSGSGTRGRILESIGQGRVVLTTTIGAEGLALTPGEGLYLADSPLEFARALNHLVPALEERKRSARLGWQEVENNYSWSVVAKELVGNWKNLL